MLSLELANGMPLCPIAGTNNATGPSTTPLLAPGDLLRPGVVLCTASLPPPTTPTASCRGFTSPARSTQRSGAASWPKAKGASGSTSSSRPARSRTTRTSRINASPATRPSPTARATRCAWSARSRPGIRTRPPKRFWRLAEMKAALARREAGSEAVQSTTRPRDHRLRRSLLSFPLDGGRIA